MEEYRRKVRRLALERSGEPFLNATQDHAAIIIENMFRAAEHEVCIFTQHLAPAIYGREAGVEWAKIFLADDQRHRLRIVMKKGELPLLETNPLYQAIRHVPTVEVRALADDFHAQFPYRFLVADGNSYRYEADHTKCEAVAAFGSDQAKHLQDVFESIWICGEDVHLDNPVTEHPFVPA